MDKKCESWRWRIGSGGLSVDRDVDERRSSGHLTGSVKSRNSEAASSDSGDATRQDGKKTFVADFVINLALPKVRAHGLFVILLTDPYLSRISRSIPFILSVHRLRPVPDEMLAKYGSMSTSLCSGDRERHSKLSGIS